MIVGVAPVRRAPDHASELVTQALLGETFIVEEQTDDGTWWRVRLDADRYEGWLRSWYATRAGEDETERWRGSGGLRVRERQVDVLAEPRKGAEVLRVVPWQGRLVATGATAPWCEVRLPGGEKGYLLRRGLESLDDRRSRLTAARLARTAARLEGAPYLWGGRSIWGFDCSGFVQAVFAWHGVELPRDSGPQREAVRASTSGHRRRRASSRSQRAGDLLFFGPDPERVTHVALAVSGTEFLHAYGWVRRGSLDPNSEVYTPQLDRQLIGVEPTVGLWPAGTPRSGLSP